VGQAREFSRLMSQKLYVLRHALREPSTLRRREHNFIDAGKPLILISQIQRSGGTLLSQLFDGHPEVLAHPAEIQVGYPRKWNWLPEIEPGDRFLFEKLCEYPLFEMGLRGKYRKDASAPATLPFAFSARRYRRVLLQLARADASRPGLYRACMSALFTAWLDYHHRAPELLQRKRFVSGFVPRLLMFDESVASLFETCPQVKILTLIRDPFSWYASAKRHNASYHDIAGAMALWARSARASFELAQRRPDACKLLFFRDLVHDCERTMRAVCDFIGLAWDEALLTPTFNGLLIRSDSNFKATVGIVDKEVTERWRDHLGQGEIEFVQDFLEDERLPPPLATRFRPPDSIVRALDRRVAAG
jgi:hypothetical protein